MAIKQITFLKLNGLRWTAGGRHSARYEPIRKLYPKVNYGEYVTLQYTGQLSNKDSTVDSPKKKKYKNIKRFL